MDQASNPIARLLQSSKALVAMPMILGSFVAFHYSKISWTECTEFVKWIWLSWAGVQGAEDVVKHYSAGKAVVAETAARASLAPPAK
jgi:hypothetical protein